MMGLLSFFTGARKSAPRRLGLEAFEARLTMSWASVPPAQITVPATATAVTFNASRAAQGSAAVSQNEVDYYSFTAPVAGSYQLATTASIDTVLAVFNASGQRLAYNDDISSTNRASRATVTLAAGQKYYVGITNYTGTANGNYSWAFTGPAAQVADDAYENNDTFATASSLNTLTALKTIPNLVMADGHDYYKFTVTNAGDANSYVSISFTHSQGDLDLKLFNASGQQLSVSQGEVNSERISLSGLAAGTYVIDVYGYNGATNPNYTLEIKPGVAVANPPPSNGAFQIDLVASGLTASQQAIFQQAVARWQQVIVGDLPNATYRGIAVDDLRIDASISSIDGAGGVLGQAGPDAFRSGSLIPYHGTMQFDSADIAAMEADGSLRSVIEHEIGHILGIGTIWSSRGLLSGAGTSNPRFTGAQATAAYNAIFGVSESGVPVENSGGSGTRDSHWRETILRSELMTGYAGPFGTPGTDLPLSRITIASLADLGYQVNMNVADSFTAPTQSSLTSGSSSSARASLVSEAATDIVLWSWNSEQTERRRTYDSPA